MDLAPYEYESYIERNVEWNFWVNLLVDLTFYNLAMSFIFGRHSVDAVRLLPDRIVTC